MATLNAKSIPNAFEMVEENNKEEDKVKEKRSWQVLGSTAELPLLILGHGGEPHNFWYSGYHDFSFMLRHMQRLLTVISFVLKKYFCLRLPIKFINFVYKR